MDQSCWQSRKTRSTRFVTTDNLALGVPGVAVGDTPLVAAGGVAAGFGGGPAPLMVYPAPLVLAGFGADITTETVLECLTFLAGAVKARGKKLAVCLGHWLQRC